MPLWLWAMIGFALGLAAIVVPVAIVDAASDIRYWLRRRRAKSVPSHYSPPEPK